MTNDEYEEIAKKSLEIAPDWLMEDLDRIAEKAGRKLRISYVINELYNRYTFNLTHVFSAIGRTTEWAVTSRERLNFIDNNIDLIQLMLKAISKNKGTSGESY